MKIGKDFAQRQPPLTELSKINPNSKKQLIWPLNHSKRHFNKLTKLLPIAPPKSIRALN